MRTFFCFFLTLGLLSTLSGQTPFKQVQNQPYVAPAPLQISKFPTPIAQSSRLGNNWIPGTLNAIQTQHESVSSSTITNSGSFWIELNPNQLWSTRSSLRTVLETIIPTTSDPANGVSDWKVHSQETDAMGRTCVRVQQSFSGIPILGQDMILHLNHGELRGLNGFAWTGNLPGTIPAPVQESVAFEKARNFLVSQKVSFQNLPSFEGMAHAEDVSQLIWFPEMGKLKLAYEIQMHPNIMDHWTIYVDAVTLEVLKSISQRCSIAPLHLYDLSAHRRPGSDLTKEAHTGMTSAAAVVGDGPTVIMDQDLSGINRTVNAYLVGTNFFMIDASHPGMFKSNQSILPNEPVGVIWTVDAQNRSPQKPNFEIVHVTNTNNNWKNLEVSGHYNAGEAYSYFLQKFNRNSINGGGGNIISIINVTDENGNDMDNAFWSGAAMFYGNGDVAFNAPLAKALDVAGHEMSHGVIQNSANLEYVGQSGALNESYADIFGAMIDRDDWQLGEDVSNPAVFPTGALRDLSNPNNGGTGPSSPGWQPKHMNEYQNLPNTPEGDNGGVHVNSGIPNRAFFLLATAIGKDKAEQIYYRALTNYLVKSSQFIDMRIAAEKAAGDIHGAGSPEVIAVRTAFDGVGIGSGQGGDYEEDIDVNEGDDFILFTDHFETDVYWMPPSNPFQFVKMDLPAPISRPSFTDDGSAAVYVDVNHDMIVIYFDWSQGLNYQAFYLEDNPQGIWQNVVVSKDGSKIAYTTSNQRNEIWVFDFNGSGNEVFTLYNPTTASGGSTTGDVVYADAMEWDYSGEYIMYDALNKIPSNFGNGINYWDISFLKAWSNSQNSFGSGQIGKLFSALPENVSVGNASFAKNSPYIITFDFLEDYYDTFGQLVTDYRIKAANIEAGKVNDIYINNTIGYPSYSRTDDQILFTYDNNGEDLLATIDIQANDKTKPVVGTDVILITGAREGVWFSTGSRIFTSTDHAGDLFNAVTVQPQPASDELHVLGEGLSEGAEYKIFELSGRLIREGILSADGAIRIASFNPGMYLLQIKGNKDRVHNLKFVKQ